VLLPGDAEIGSGSGSAVIGSVESLDLNFCLDLELDLELDLL